MRLDQYSNPIFNEQDLFDALYKGQSLSADLIAELSPNIDQLEAVSDIHFSAPFVSNSTVTVNEFDQAMQQDWFMPEEYKNFDIISWVMNNCPEEYHERTAEELEAFTERNMLDLLRWLKYFVDTCTKENILWGIGRGSSVASYVLYLIGVHNIDSIKYNLDWREFLR